MTAAPAIAAEPTVADAERRRRAHHEAGHVVARLALFPSQHFLVTVEPSSQDLSQGIGGWVRPVHVVQRWSGKSETRWFGRYLAWYLRQCGTELYAGCASESFRSPFGSLSLEALEGSKSDREQLVTLARRFGRTRPFVHWPSLMRAQRLIDERFGQLTAIAAALEARGAINSKQARQIAEAAPPLTNRRPTSW